jgi:hypothetical protein
MDAAGRSILDKGSILLLSKLMDPRQPATPLLGLSHLACGVLSTRPDLLIWELPTPRSVNI